MQASELRIGNWVQNPKHYIPGAYQLTGEKIKEIEEGDLDPDPFRLTEAGLEALGFSHLHDGIKYNDLRLSFGFFRIRTLDGGYIQIEFDTPFGSRQLKYLHEVQNWFYALTGEELTIKEHESQK